ncbi:DUF4649 family protein [Lactococcus insecticola]|uniref:DUF4649 domain-containing protein n=1 Tax=Pseudolactococcus insecticola TaxID=2709158 RepID=A0A6A0B854_9LACT|nr:DUF4649 family protein [Lactococcus insecticola]GFH40985.1 hypothetical protein Hs20B_13830 [Lactococcus insecticola]
MKITYHNGANAAETKTFKDVAEFIMLQLREIPAIQDHYEVDEVSIDGKKVEFKGTIGDLFDFYNH